MIPLHDNNPTTLFPVFTIIFMVLCVFAFLWQVGSGDTGNQRIILGLGMIPAVLFDQVNLPASLILVPAELTLLTSMFLHGGWMHLIGNMLYLWVFGNNVEDAMGHLRFILFYLLCGGFAALGQALMQPASQIPMIGASGAISGVLGAYLLLYPRSRILVVIPLGLLFPLLRIPAGWVLGAWFAIQIFSSLGASAGQGGVAWFAHIGGFIAGMALIPFFKQKDVRLFAAANGSRRFFSRNPFDQD